ncbi:MAG TPA: CehA/McbA family metallohydrolase, partial [Vicinamibacteria bacterium]
GVDVTVEVRISTAARGGAPPLPARAPEPLRRGPAWYAGALHTHTLHSDGRLTAAALAEKARAEGLDFLAITDHNNTAHQREPLQVPGLLVITGEEVTTPAGHASVWGLGGPREVVDFRAIAGDGGWARLVAAAHQRGALVSINHPFAGCLACSWTESLPEGLDGIEVRNPGGNTAQAMALWDTLLRQGRRLTAVGASDWHREGSPIGAPSVRVWAEELSGRAVLAAIREGRVVVMADARTAPPELEVRAGGQTARPGETLRLAAPAELDVVLTASGPAYEGATAHLVWRGERVASAPLRPGAAVRFAHWAGAPGYLRVEVEAAGAAAPLALTNPVFVEMGGSGSTSGGPSPTSGSSPSQR